MNPYPVIVTTVPIGPLVGANVVITGAGGGGEPTSVQRAMPDWGAPAMEVK